MLRLTKYPIVLLSAAKDLRMMLLAGDASLRSAGQRLWDRRKDV